MARPYKVRDKRSGEIIEFEWDDPAPPTRDDIDRIVEERKSKPFEPPVREPIDSGLNTPRFPTRPSSNVRDEITEEPTFRTEVFGDRSMFPGDEPTEDIMAMRRRLGYGRQDEQTFDYNKFSEGINQGVNKWSNLVGEQDWLPDFGKKAAAGLGSLVGSGVDLAGSFLADPSSAATSSGIMRGLNRPRTALKAATEIEPLAEAAGGNIASKLDDITAPPNAATATRKPKYRLSIDDTGKRTYIPIPDAAATSEALPPLTTGTTASLPAPQKLGALPVANLGARLPNDLAGAKPRFNIGTNSYQPVFESDLDKALYIISQPKTSKRNADYMKFVMDNTGMTEAEARAAGQQVKAQLHQTLKGQEVGLNKVPKLYNPATENAALGAVNAAPTMVSKEGQSIADDLARSLAERNKVNNTGKTTAVLTGDEVGAVPPQVNKAAAQKLPETGIPPSAQEQQAIKDIVPKNMTEALEQLNSIEKKLREAGKSETFIGHIATQFWNFPKASWATLDMSAPLRQGKGLIYRGEYWRALDDMIKSGWSEQGYIDTMAKIKSKELYPIMEKYNPGLTNLKKGGKGLLEREENLVSDWAENIPSLGSIGKALKEWDIKHARTYVFDPSGVGKGKEALGKTSLFSRAVRGADRAYVGFLNTVRADTMENMIHGFEKAGMSPLQDPNLLKYTSDFIATATGRASLGNFEAAAETLNKYSFSVRFAKSRLDMGVLAPVKWAKAPLAVKKEVGKSLISQAMYTAAFTTIAGAAGAETIWDLTNSDFGKTKIGNIRIDTMAGLQQPLVATIRILSGLSTSPTTRTTTVLGEGYRADTGVDVAANFTRSKLSPWTGLLYDGILKGKTINGKPTSEELQRYDLDNYMFKMMAPNLVSTISDLAQEDPKYLQQLGIPLSRFFTPDGKPIPIPVILSGLGIVGLASLGESVQVFDPPQQQKVRKKGLSSFSYEGRKK